MIFDFVYYQNCIFVAYLIMVLIYEVYSLSGNYRKLLAMVSGVISNSQSRPILEISFELENEILKITASDGEKPYLAVKSDDQRQNCCSCKIFRFN